MCGDIMDVKQRRTDDEELEESFERCPRFHVPHELTDEQIETIATNAAKKAVELAKKDLYQGVGKTVVGWSFYIIGAAAVGLFAVGVKMGWFKP